MDNRSFFYKSIREKLNISTIVKQKVTLTKRGSEYLGLCPFHSEKTPSFTVNDQKKFYYCFGCSAYGDVIKFTAEISGLSYRESALKLAKENGIDIPVLSKTQEMLYEEIDEIHNVLELSQNFFIDNLSCQAKSYLQKRGLSEQEIKRYKIGYSPGKNLLQRFLEAKKIPLTLISKAGLVTKKDNGKIYEVFRDRIMFPIINASNKVLGFGGRVLDDNQPKYLNSPETLVFKKSEVLYGENIAISSAYSKGKIMVVEGYMDLIILQSSGFNETVATLGTALTERHLNRLWQVCNEIILCFDGDTAGTRASRKVIEMILPYINCSRTMSFITLPNSLDPDQVLQQYGVQYFQKLINNRLPVSEKLWDLETNGKVFVSAESKAILEKKINNYIKQIKDWILAKNYQFYFKRQYWKLNNYSSKNLNNDKFSQQNRRLHLEISSNKRKHLEYVLLSLIVNFPELVTDEIIFENLASLEFCNDETSNLKEWLINNMLDKDLNLNKNLAELIKNTRFFELFLVLLHSPVLLSGISSNKEHNPRLLWRLFYQKYQIATLKDEYIKVLNNNHPTGFEKANIYQQEILKIERETNLLNETLNLEKGKYGKSA